MGNLLLPLLRQQQHSACSSSSRQPTSPGVVHSQIWDTSNANDEDQLPCSTPFVSGSRHTQWPGLNKMWTYCARGGQLINAVCFLHMTAVVACDQRNACRRTNHGVLYLAFADGNSFWNVYPKNSTLIRPPSCTCLFQ